MTGTSPTWLTPTYTSAQLPSRTASPRPVPYRSNRHFQRKPTLRSAGHSDAVCNTMPSVVPTPITRTCAAVIVDGFSVSGPGSAMNTTAAVITTKLLRIGAHIGAKKWSRVLSTAARTAARP